MSNQIIECMDKDIAMEMSKKTVNNKARFLQLRKRVFDLIANELSIDPYCKSYEGAIEVLCEYPDYFDDEQAIMGANYYLIKLHCYVLGDLRHYEFKGETFEQALDEFENQIAGWERGREE